MEGKRTSRDLLIVDGAQAITTFYIFWEATYTGNYILFETIYIYVVEKKRDGRPLSHWAHAVVAMLKLRH